MTAAALVFVALAWLLTYAVHSTLLLTGAWWLGTRLPARAHRVRERLWKFALLGGVLTATLQLSTGLRPFTGTWSLGAESRSARIEPDVEHELAGLDSGGLDAGVLDWIQTGPELLATDLAFEACASDTGEAAAALPAGVWLADGAKTGPAGPFPKARRVRLVARGDGDLGRLGALDDVNALGALGSTRESLASVDVAPDSGPVVAHVFAVLDREPSLGAADGKVLFPAGVAPPLWLAVLLLALWLARGLVGLFALGRAHVGLRDRLAGRLLLEAGPLHDSLQDLLRRTGVRRAVRLTCSPRLATPISLGVFRREICVPLRALTDLRRGEQESMLAHELAHVVRRDAAWLHVYEILDRLLFFQPMNRLARRGLRESTECLCDDWAVARTGRSLDLARCLTQVAGWVLAAPEALPAPCMADASAPLTHRVERLLESDSTLRETRNLGLTFTALGLLSAVAVAAPGVSAFDDRTSPDVERREAYTVAFRLGPMSEGELAALPELPTPGTEEPDAEPVEAVPARPAAAVTQRRVLTLPAEALLSGASLRNAPTTRAAFFVDAPEVAEQRGASTRLPLVERMLLLDVELDALQSELGGLLEITGEPGLPPELGTALQGLQERVERLRAQRSTLRTRLDREVELHLVMQHAPRS